MYLQTTFFNGGEEAIDRTSGKFPRRAVLIINKDQRGNNYELNNREAVAMKTMNEYRVIQVLA